MSTVINGARLEDGHRLVECDGTLLIVCDYFLDDDDTGGQVTRWSAFPAVQHDRREPFAWSDPVAWWDRTDHDMGDFKDADAVVAYLRERCTHVRVLFP